ncbi:MAG: glycosyltransferase family 39 protein [Myxococcota bacterium]
MKSLYTALLIALVVRVGLFAAMPHSSRYATDTQYYAQLAENLRAGHGFSSQTSPPYSPSIERPPGYPALMAAVWTITGTNYTALAFAQILIDLLAVAFIWGAARRRFGVGPATVASLLYAVLPFTAGTALQFMSEGVAMALVALALYGQVRAGDSDSTVDVARWALLAGLALGVGAMFRSYLAPLAAVAGVVVAFELAAQKAWSRAAVAFVALGIGSALPVGAWVARNAYVSVTTEKPFVLIEQFGSREEFVKLYTPGFRAWYKSYDEPFLWLDYQKPPRANYFTPEEKDEVAALWTQIMANDGAVSPRVNAAFQRIADERYAAAPLRLLIWRPLSLGAKFWLSPRASTLRMSLGRAGTLAQASRLIVIFFFLMNAAVAGLALVGILAHGRRAKGVILWALPLALTTILVIIVHRESRLTMPLFPILVVAAGVGAMTVRDTLKAWRTPRVVQQPAGA